VKNPFKYRPIQSFIQILHNIWSVRQVDFSFYLNSSTMAAIFQIKLIILVLISTWYFNGSVAALVTCGSVIKLEHSITKYVLQSQDVAYGHGRGSGGQVITGIPDKNSATSLWTIRSGDEDSHCTQGTPIENGMEIRLQHTMTSRWLHSHRYASPLSNNQEISAFGDDDQTDSGDVWIVELEKGAKSWAQDAGVYLKHKETGVYLASHELKYQRPIAGHTEVFGTEKKQFCNWKATEGIYFMLDRSK